MTFEGPRAPGVSNIVVDSSGTFLTATVTAHKKRGGTYDVVVTNPDGSTARLDGAFTVVKPPKAGSMSGPKANLTSYKIDAAIAAWAELDSESDDDAFVDSLAADLALLLAK